MYLISSEINAKLVMSRRSMTPVIGASVRYVRTKTRVDKVSLIKCEYGRNVVTAKDGLDDRRLVTHILAMPFNPNSKPYCLRAVQAS